MLAMAGMAETTSSSSRRAIVAPPCTAMKPCVLSMVGCFFFFFVLCSFWVLLGLVLEIGVLEAGAGQGRAGAYTSTECSVHILTNSIDTCSQIWTGPKRYCDESQCACANRSAADSSGSMQAESRSEARLWGESECRTRHALRRSASGAHEQGWPLYRVRAVGAIRCLGPVAQALPVCFVPGNELLPRFCSRRRREACGWAEFC
ncbi:hypothetical protein HDV63DRAFT_239434 [Trichoderma sp. SZMC 28014]